MRSLLDRISGQEKMKFDEMIDKQAREMLALIDKKVRQKSDKFSIKKDKHCSLMLP